MKRLLNLACALACASGLATSYATPSDVRETTLTPPAASDPSATLLPGSLMKRLPAGAKVSQPFPAAGGLIGHIVTTGPFGNAVVFTLPGNDDMMISGKILTSDGTDLNSEYLSKYAPVTALGQFGQKLRAAPAIDEGATGSAVKSEIYVFMDPNCIFCHTLWKALQPYETAGLQVHWIPMGFLKADSAGKAAALLQAENKAALLRQLEQNFSVKDESGGIDPASNIMPETTKAITDNRALFNAMGFHGTPAIV
jgi:thiol:disulfide interchange protein DsbG